MDRRTEKIIERVQNTPVGTAIKVRSSVYVVNSYVPIGGSNSLCAGCELSDVRGIPDCPYWKACTGRFRPDRTSVILKKYVKQ